MSACPAPRVGGILFRHAGGEVQRAAKLHIVGRTCEAGVLREWWTALETSENDAACV